MDSSASDSRKEFACISNFSKLSKKIKIKKNQENDYHSCEHFVTYLFFITFLKCKKINGKSKSKYMYANALKTVMGLVAIAVMQKNEQEELLLPELKKNISKIIPRHPI